MQPLRNLKTFLAALLVFAVPGALLVAYFRDYSPDAGGHEHAAGGASASHASGHDAARKSAGTKENMPMKSHGDMSSDHKTAVPGSMGHENMPSADPVQPAMADAGPAAVMHIGAKGFFLDRPQTFTPRADQAKALRDIKDRSAMDMMAADKTIQQIEEHLWKLTSQARPNIAEIEAKVREAEKLRGDQRIAFIRSVTEAANLLTAEQKENLLRTTRAAKPGANLSSSPGEQAKGKAEPAHKH